MNAYEYQEMCDELGAQSELRNCYEEARMTLSIKNAKENEVIQLVVDAGQFVVVEEVPYYCKSTDGFAGMAQRLRTIHDSREEAQASINALCEGGELLDEGNFFILPRGEEKADDRDDYYREEEGDGVPF